MIKNIYNLSIKIYSTGVTNLDNGNLIRSYRKKKGLTMKELGYKVGVSEQAISQYERSLRTPNTVTLQKICRHLNLPIEKFSLKLPSIPTAEEIDKNPELELNTQIEVFCDDMYRSKVKLLCNAIQALNYTVEIDNNNVLITDNLTCEVFLEMPKNQFYPLSELFYSNTEGFIMGLKNYHNCKKNENI